MQKVEIISTNSTSVSCSGFELPFDHPQIYLEIDPIKNFILCPYCGQKFALTK